MKSLTVFIATILIGSSGVALAQKGVSGNSPGHLMQRNGPVSGSPGASGYAPGHLKQQKGSISGYAGASGYAPGRRVTTSVRARSTTTGSGATIQSNTRIRGRLND